jgi:hypothetical protein
MFTFPRFALGICYLLMLSTLVCAQDQQQTDRLSSTSSVTAVTLDGRVRFTAPANVSQMRVQVTAADGQIIFDLTKAGNVFDWRWLDGQAAPITSGTYTCVVTIKSLNNRTSQRLARMTVDEKHLKLQALAGAQLTDAQRQALGVDKQSSALTVLVEKDVAAITAIGHDGADGEVTSTTGALTFRTGDFFAGTEQEQMRITPDGKVGIGTRNPQATLDVAGTIHAAKGIEFADGTVQTTGLSGRKDKDGNFVPTIAGTGTQNKIAKWIDNAGTLGDSAITQDNTGNVGIGVVIPLFPLHIAHPTFAQAYVAGGTAADFLLYHTNAPANARWFGLRAQDGRGKISSFNDNGTYRIDGILAWDNATGNVGVGTITPVAKLDVTGTINTSTQYNIGGLRILSNAGSSNIFVGVGAGNANPSGNLNSFFGKDAGFSNTTGFSGSFFGASAGRDNTTGRDNTFIGASAGENNTDGLYNTFIGANAGKVNTSGVHNTFIGRSAALNNILGNDNVIIGYLAGFNSNADANTFLGEDSGNSNTTGASNTFVGKSSGFSNATGSNITLIGVDTNTTVDGLTYATAIGSGATVGVSNRVVLGRTADTVRIPGDLIVVGSVSKGSGSFTIDHPLDPANKTLSHSFVESPDMMNIYNGNIITNARGQAVVVLPAYFDSLNRDFRYQLTVVGQFAQAIIARKVSGNRFVIRTSKPRVEVSWQVTGIRHDAYADMRRIKVEEDKPEQERGSYLHPEAFTNRTARQSGTGASRLRQSTQK